MDEPLNAPLEENSDEIVVIDRIPRFEIVALLAFLVLADLTIYRGEGFAGLTVFTLAAPGLLCLGAGKFPKTFLSTGILFLIVLVSLKLVWSGTGLAVFYGVALIVVFAMELAGLTPFVLDTLAFCLHLVKSGFLRLEDYFEAAKESRWSIPRVKLLQYGLPMVAVFGFGGIFVMANPDLAMQTRDWFQRALDLITNAVSRFAPRFSEGLFWLGTAWIFAGLVKPLVTKSILAEFSHPFPDRIFRETPKESAIFPAYFNTLVAVIVLFVAYLAFEFKTLWFRTFPEGFHYSGYAHEGAAWLTVALGLATVVLSVMFRRNILIDPRVAKLRRLAWIWSILNLCLAIAVYHRLMIYVGFNGMTRMRTVGFLGITSVVVGFLLVVHKIKHAYEFAWLIHRQLWVVVFAGFLFAVLPVDSLVHRYNTQRILAGDPAPSVQISVHPLDTGGVMELIPLLDSENAIIREGVRAMLAQKALDLRNTRNRRQHDDWTSYQWADAILSQRLERSPEVWSRYEKANLRDAAWNTFQKYAYQWY